MDLSTVRRQGDRLLSALARLELEGRLGRAASADLLSVFQGFPALASPEPFACAREAFQGAAKEDQAPIRAALDLAATALELARTASFDAQRLAFQANAKVLVEGAPVPWREVGRRLAAEPVREVRAPLARAADGALARLDADLCRRVEACQRLASDLGYGSYEALRAEATGVDLAAAAGEAEKLLRDTDDAWRDLFSFALRRLVGPVALRPRGEAAEHDLVRFARLMPLDDLFKARRLLPTAQAALEAMGFVPDARGRLSLDAEDAPGRPAGGAALALEVPEQIEVVLGRQGGVPDYAALFHALGRAHALAAASPELPVDQRRGLGERARLESFGALFEQLLLELGFLRRHLDADPKEAVEAARLVAIRRLAELRQQCASLVYQRTLYAEGPREEMRGLYRELHGKALGVDWPLERWLFDVEPRFGAAARLRGFALAEVVRKALLEVADEDWWRNPRTSAFLARLAADGSRTGAETVAKDLGGALSLAGAAGQLISIAAR